MVKSVDICNNWLIEDQLNDLITIYPATQQLNTKLSNSKITVVPSRNEGFGMVLLEAMAQDNIVIAF